MSASGSQQQRRKISRFCSAPPCNQQTGYICSTHAAVGNQGAAANPRAADGSGGANASQNRPQSPGAQRQRNSPQRGNTHSTPANPNISANPGSSQGYSNRNGNQGSRYSPQSKARNGSYGSSGRRRSVSPSYYGPQGPRLSVSMFGSPGPPASSSGAPRPNAPSPSPNGPSTRPTDYSNYTLKQLENNPSLFRDALSQSTLFHAMLAANTRTQAANTTTASSSSTQSSITPFSRTASSLLSHNYRNNINMVTSTTSPYEVTFMDVKIRKHLMEKIVELQATIKVTIGNDKIDNNREFLMAYEDISRFIQSAHLQPLIETADATYNSDQSEILEKLVRAIFKGPDAISIILQGKTATITGQPTPNASPHPYYLWQSLAQHYTIDHRLFEELRTELHNLQWNGADDIKDMSGLHTYVMTRIHLLQTDIAKQHSTTAFSNNQLFFALDKFLKHPQSPYRREWSDEYRNVMNKSIDAQYDQLLKFIRDMKNLEGQMKSNTRRTTSTKVATLVASTSSQQHEQDMSNNAQPFTLASSGGNTLSQEYDTYLTEHHLQDEGHDDDTLALYSKGQNYNQAQQHNKKFKYQHHRTQQDTNFHHNQSIVNNHPAAQFINQIPTKANYSPRIHQGQPQQATTQYLQGPAAPHAHHATPSSYHPQGTQYASAASPMQAKHHPTYVAQPHQQQIQYPDAQQLDTYEALPLHYNQPQGYRPSFPPSPPIYQYAQSPPSVYPQQQQYTQPHPHHPHQRTMSHATAQHQQQPQAAHQATTSLHQHLHATAPSSHQQQPQQQQSQYQHQHQRNHRYQPRPMVPSNNQYLPTVHNSQTSQLRPLTQYDRSAFFVEEQPVHDAAQDWTSQQMETYSTPVYLMEPRYEHPTDMQDHTPNL